MKIKDKVRYILGAPHSFFLSNKYSCPEIMNSIETLEYIIQNGCSIVRFGDGEMNLMRGVGIKFQDSSKEIQQKLFEVANYNSDNKLLICLPNLFTEQAFNALTEKEQNWHRNVLKCTRGYWYKFFRGDLYGDAFISRFYMQYQNQDYSNYIQKLKQLWNDKKVLIVEGKTSRIGVGNDLFDNCKMISRILCPAKNAFSKYAEIIRSVSEWLSVCNNALVISALGPTATALCYDLSLLGYQALDLGHIDIEYEWYLKGAKEKMAIAGKSVSEVTEEVSELYDMKYEEQIQEIIV